MQTLRHSLLLRAVFRFARNWEHHSVLIPCSDCCILSANKQTNELYLAYGRVADIIHESGAMPIPSVILQTGEYDYSTDKNYLPEGIQSETLIHVNRATTDLRTQSINHISIPTQKWLSNCTWRPIYQNYL